MTQQYEPAQARITGTSTAVPPFSPAQFPDSFRETNQRSADSCGLVAPVHPPLHVTSRVCVRRLRELLRAVVALTPSSELVDARGALREATVHFAHTLAQWQVRQRSLSLNPEYEQPGQAL